MGRLTVFFSQTLRVQDADEVGLAELQSLQISMLYSDCVTGYVTRLIQQSFQQIRL
jgi:hypothetical protein